MLEIAESRDCAARESPRPDTGIKGALTNSSHKFYKFWMSVPASVALRPEEPPVRARPARRAGERRGRTRTGAGGLPCPAQPCGTLGSGTGAVPGPFPGEAEELGAAPGSVPREKRRRGSRPRSAGPGRALCRCAAGAPRPHQSRAGPLPLSPVCGGRTRRGSGTGGRSEPGIDAGAAAGRDERGERRRANVGPHLPLHPSVHPSIHAPAEGRCPRAGLAPVDGMRWARTGPSPPGGTGNNARLRAGQRRAHGPWEPRQGRPRSAAPGPGRCPCSPGPHRPAAG